MNENFIKSETADILNDQKWTGRDFIFVKKPVPGKTWPVSGFLFFDDRRTVYDAEDYPVEDISEIVQTPKGPGGVVLEIVRKPGVKLDRSSLPLVKRYDSVEAMVRDGWMVD